MPHLKIVKSGKYWKIRNSDRKTTYSTQYSTKKAAETKKIIMNYWFQNNLAKKQRNVKRGGKKAKPAKRVAKKGKRGVKKVKRGANKIKKSGNRARKNQRCNRRARRRAIG